MLKDDERKKMRKPRKFGDDIPYPGWVAKASSLNLMFEDQHGIVRQLSTLDQDHEIMTEVNQLLASKSAELYQLAQMQEAKEMLQL